MKAQKLISLADEGSGIRDRLTDILSGLSSKFYDHDGPVLSRESQADPLDLAATARDREMCLRLMERQRDRFQEILEALHRIETGGYGICEDCGEEINPRRLKVYPATTLCIECKKEQEDLARKQAPSFRTLSTHPA